MKKMNFKQDIKNNMTEKKEVEKESVELVENENNWGVLEIEKEKKETKKQIPVYLKKELLERLNKIAKQSGKNRNDIINLILDHGSKKIKIK